MPKLHKRRCCESASSRIPLAEDEDARGIIGTGVALAWRDYHRTDIDGRRHGYYRGWVGLLARNHTE